MSTALVVFSDNSGVWWLKLLKPGFRHCFVILETDRGCIWVDPLSNSLTIKMLEGYELAGLLQWYRDMGMKVLRTSVNGNRARPFAWGPMSCVEVVKRLIGLRNGAVLTPWQLCQAIEKNKKRVKRKKVLDFCGGLR